MVAGALYIGRPAGWPRGGPSPGRQPKTPSNNESLTRRHMTRGFAPAPRGTLTEALRGFGPAGARSKRAPNFVPDKIVVSADVQDAQVSRFQDEKERRKSPKPFAPAPSPARIAGPLIASVASAGPRRDSPCPCGGRATCSASLSLLPLASPGFAFPGKPVQRGQVQWTFAYIRFTPLAPLRAGRRLGRRSARRRAQNCTNLGAARCAGTHKCRGFMAEQERPRLDRRRPTGKSEVRATHDCMDAGGRNASGTAVEERLP